MLKIFYLNLLMLTLAFHAYGQKELLQLTYGCREQSVAFGTVKIIDNRSETQIIGIIQTGMMNRLTEVKFTGNLTDSLAVFFTDTSASASKNTLVLMLNEFYLNERPSNGIEGGNFRLSLRLFSGNQANRFAELLTIDSTYSVEGMDVTKKLLKSVSEHFCFIAKKALTLQSRQNTTQSVYYSFEDLSSLDSLEKQKLPMYQADQTQAGIYKNYTQFKINEPEKTGEIFIEETKKGIIQVFVWDEQKRKKSRVDATSLYAVSDGKTLLRGTFLGFHKIIKEKSDFYYWRPVLDNSTQSYPMYYIPVSGGLIGGLIGGALSGALSSAMSGSTGKNKWVLQKINHRRGNSVPVAWVQKKPE